jgi:hypothetical protein
LLETKLQEFELARIAGSIIPEGMIDPTATKLQEFELARIAGSIIPEGMIDPTVL